MLTFLDEWVALAKSGSRERGIANLWSARKNAPTRRKGKLIQGLNPCLRGDMRLLTPEGYREIAILADEQECEIINASGETVISKVWWSGYKPTVKIRLYGKDMDDIYCTPDHRFMTADRLDVQAENLKGHRLMPFIQIKDSFELEEFLAGFIQGDGSTGRLIQPDHKGMEVEFGEKDGDIAAMYGQQIGEWRSQYVYGIAEKYHLSHLNLPERELPDNKYITPNFLSGLFSANGCVISGYRVAIK